MVSNLNYVSIDIETLGLDSSKHKTIEVGFVLDNSLHRINYNNINSYIESLPLFHCYIRHDDYEGDPYALVLNKDTISLIQDNKLPNIINAEELAPLLDKWFNRYLNSKITPAGKNFSGFDRQFLNAIPGVKSVLDKWLIHRTLDPSIYYFDENVDTKPPDLKTCLDRALINKEVAHTAVEDAIDVIRLLRNIWDKSYI